MAPNFRLNLPGVPQRSQPRAAIPDIGRRRCSLTIDRVRLPADEKTRICGGRAADSPRLVASVCLPQAGFRVRPTRTDFIQVSLIKS